MEFVLKHFQGHLKHAVNSVFMLHSIMQRSADDNLQTRYCMHNFILFKTVLAQREKRQLKCGVTLEPIFLSALSQTPSDIRKPCTVKH